MSGSEYVSFYDESQQYWSVRFDTMEASLLFARYIALVRSKPLGFALSASALHGLHGLHGLHCVCFFLQSMLFTND